jgi:hypothetical protein
LAIVDASHRAVRARAYLTCIFLRENKNFKRVAATHYGRNNVRYVSDNRTLSGPAIAAHSLIAIHFSAKGKALSFIAWRHAISSRHSRVSLPYENTKLRYVTQFRDVGRAGEKKAAHSRREGVREAKNKYLSAQQCYPHFRRRTMQFISQN